MADKDITTIYTNEGIIFFIIITGHIKNTYTKLSKVKMHRSVEDWETMPDRTST